MLVSRTSEIVALVEILATVIIATTFNAWAPVAVPNGPLAVSLGCRPSVCMSLQPGENSAQERRIARNGGTYTLQDFLDYHSDELGHKYWVEARVAGAPQPGGPGPDAPPVLTLAIQQPTRTVGAFQPGVNPWQGCVFLTETLRRIRSAFCILNSVYCILYSEF